MENRLLAVSMGVGLVLCGLAVSITASTSTKLPVLAPGQYTIGRLMEVIRSGGAATAQFFIPKAQGNALSTASYEANPGSVNGSTTVSGALLTLVDISKPAIASQLVTLKRAPEAHLQALRDQNRIRGFGVDYSAFVQQVLLYADIGGHPMFLFEPCPAKMIGTPGATHPIVPLLQKWQVAGDLSSPATYSKAPVAPAAPQGQPANNGVRRNNNSNRPKTGAGNRR